MNSGGSHYRLRDAVDEEDAQVSGERSRLQRARERGAHHTPAHDADINGTWQAPSTRSGAGAESPGRHRSPPRPRQVGHGGSDGAKQQSRHFGGASSRRRASCEYDGEERTLRRGLI